MRQVASALLDGEVRESESATVPAGRVRTAGVGADGEVLEHLGAALEHLGGATGALEAPARRRADGSDLATRSRAREDAPTEEFNQTSAIVEAASEETRGEFQVRGASGVVVAQKAASCLLTPGVGDRVLLATRADGLETFILAVLTRASTERPSELSFDGDVKLRAPDGVVTLEAKEGIHLRTPGDLDAAVNGLKLDAEDAKFFVRSMVWLGREMVGRVGVAKLAGGTLDRTFTTVIEKLTRSYRTIEETESVRAGTFDVRCEQAVLVHGENASVTASHLIKMDGAQIVMG